MAKIRYRETFPCSYQIEIEVLTSFFDFGTSHVDTKNTREKGCPLHGKNCSK